MEQLKELIKTGKAKETAERVKELLDSSFSWAVPRRSRFIWGWFLALIMALAACDRASEGEPAYELAQRCFAVRADRTEGFLVANEEGSYDFLNVPEEEADRFFLKPTGLGTFLLYDQERGFLAADGFTLRRQKEANDGAEWKVNELEILSAGATAHETYTLVSTEHRRRLLVGAQGPVLRAAREPMLAAQAALDLVELPADTCELFPEAPLNAVVSPEFFDPRDPAEPVVGYADVHAHLGFAKSLGAVGMAGDLFHRFGIEHALDDCADLHGPDGTLDFLGTAGGAPRHATAGYPHFTDWPTRGAVSHTQAYYRWIQRAYLSGLRLVVTLATGNSTYCQALRTLRPRLREGDCSPASTVELQTLAMYDLQDYVDAQEGGPGRGWFRVVTSPDEAREVIAENKLAVVLGVEYSTLLDCRVGQEAKCTPKYVDEELDKLHDLGIRSVYPIHRFDNAFGGTWPMGGTGNAYMNLTNKMNTGKIDHILDLIRPGRLLFDPSVGGQFWELGECPPGASGKTNIRNMQEFIEQAFPSFGQLFDKAGRILLFDKLAPLPEYQDFGGSEPGCNIRHLQPIGAHLIHGLIDRGMIVEIDHLGYHTMIEILEIIEDRQYSGLISSHGLLDDSLEIRDRVYARGGIATRMPGNPSNGADRIVQLSEEMTAHPFATGVGIGTDVQGMMGQPTGDNWFQASYPFSSYDGLVTFEQPTVGNRVLDFTSEGVVHYGLFAERVENLRQVDEEHPADVMEIFMNSAETYLQMWERAHEAAKGLYR